MAMRKLIMVMLAMLFAAAANAAQINIKDWGATGDGTCHPLSGTYATVAAAQAVYPFVSDLTQCIDWAATQQAINKAFLVGPTGNDSAPVYCPTGLYQLSNPIFFDQANNTQGSFPAWATGTTYGNGVQVTYNGIPWQSQGSGNIGNPPTSATGYPANLEPFSGGGFPFQVVNITTASPAVFSIELGGVITHSLTANQPLVFSPQQYPVPPAGAAPRLPTGLNANQVYYVVGSSITATTFEVSATRGGAAINTTAAGVGNYFLNTQVWQVYQNIPAPDFSSHISFIGEEGLPSNSGCQFQSVGWNTAAMMLGPQAGNLIKNISLVGPANNNVIYRCENLPNLSGWLLQSNGGGASRTKFENVGARGYYHNMYLGWGTGDLSDQNTWDKVSLSDGCVDIGFVATQQYINTVYESAVNQATYGIVGNSQGGVKVIGGNHSTFTAIANSFTINTVSVNTSAGYVLTATITNPDQYLQSPMCPYSAAAAFQDAPIFVNQSLNSSSCGYNVFTIVTPRYGVVPFYIGNFNPITNVITLVIPPSWTSPYQGTCCGAALVADLTAATTLYAAESATPWYGMIQVDTNHIENLAPTTLVCNCPGFGNARAAELKNIQLDYTVSLGDYVCCNNSVTPALLAQFYAQQVIPFIDAYFGVTTENLVNGGNTGGAKDRVLIGAIGGSYVRGLRSDSAFYASFAPLYDFMPVCCYSTAFPPLNGVLSGNYAAFGVAAWGTGLWDNPSWFVSWASTSVDLLNTGNAEFMPDIWRTIGWGLSPSWGVRPAPYASPCITPAQATTLAGTLPPITFLSQLLDYLAVATGGTGYAVGDTITLAGGTFMTPAQVQVQSVGAGGAITGALVVTVNGYYTANPTTFTQASTTGAGTGATFNLPNWMVHYNVSYPMLWGGQIYRACDYAGASFTGPKYAITSSNIGYSYFQALTTTNVPNLAWHMDGASPFVYMNQEALELMAPGLVLQLTPNGSGGCPTTMEQFMVIEVHPTLGYVKVVGATADSGPYVPQWGNGIACAGTTIGQQPPNLTNPY
jgi:hypothetical protein